MEAIQNTGASQLALQAASSAAPPSQDAAAEKAAAEKAAAEKAAAEKAAAEKAAAEKAAAEKAAAEKVVAKPARQRRGPPADGQDEDRVSVLLTTSKLSGPGGKLRRGQAVSVPTRRLAALVASGKVRQGTEAELETAARRFGLGRLG